MALSLKALPQRVSKQPREVQVRVAVRVRPLLEKEIGVEKKCIQVASPSTLELCHPQVENEAIAFEFDSCYNEKSNQAKIFEREIKPLLSHPFEGFHSSCFAHGPTGSGKTFTMQGSADDPGIIPRSISYIVDDMQQRNASPSPFTYKLLLSYLEIYNEKVYDLVEPKEKELIIREDQRKNIFIKDLAEIPIDSIEDFHRTFATALENRSTAPTKLNARSSRSHAIVIAKIEKRSAEAPHNLVRVGKLHLVDLAGSEDNRRTENEGQRMKESQAINKSLFALGTVVDALNQGIRPQYRNSKLTRLLQDSLGGNSHSCVLINISPCNKHYADIHTALKFGNKSRNIVNKVVSRNIIKPLTARPPLQRSATTKRKSDTAAGPISLKRQASGTTMRERAQSVSIKSSHSNIRDRSHSVSSSGQSSKDLEEWMERKMELKMKAIFKQREEKQQEELKKHLKQQQIHNQRQQHIAAHNAVVAMTPNSKGTILKGLLLAAKAYDKNMQPSLALSKYQEALAIAQDPDHQRKIKIKIRDLKAKGKNGGGGGIPLNLDEDVTWDCPKRSGAIAHKFPSISSSSSTSSRGEKHKRPSSSSVLKDQNGQQTTNKHRKLMSKKLISSSASYSSSSSQPLKVPKNLGMKDSTNNEENDPDWVPGDTDTEIETPIKTANKKKQKETIGSVHIDEALKTKLEEKLLSALNTGDLKSLMTYDGIGKKRAEQIIAHRQDFGLFSQVHDLRKIGFGEKLLAKVVNSEIKIHYG